ncbi:MAG: nucleoside deaminase [Sphingobacteriales bacterium]|jgi:tRNA(Arg) A34 adenosine deaminase TadA|nr:nucleoside deaminase [Sphingobacteriales bacterium]
MHTDHEAFMREAIRLSIENVVTKKGGPFACVIVKNGEIIASGTNQVTSSNDPTAHAEIVAIRNACSSLGSFQLDDCDIYTSCEPCPMCLSAIYWSRARHIYFANTKSDAAKINFDDQFIYDEISKDLSERKIPMAQVLREEAIQAFELWYKLDGNIQY